MNTGQTPSHQGVRYHKLYISKIEQINNQRINENLFQHAQSKFTNPLDKNNYRTFPNVIRKVGHKQKGNLRLFSISDHSSYKRNSSTMPMNRNAH